MAADDKEVLVALQAVDKAHDLRVDAADAASMEISVRLTGGPCGSAPATADARSDLQIADADLRWRSSWAGCALHRRP